jgi:AraC family transcriptional regulator
VRIYGPGHSFDRLDLETETETWAAVAVTAPSPLPGGVELLHLPGGLYAGFTFRGPASGFFSAAAYVFGEWLPASGYAADARPHYEVLGPGYRPDAEDAEEQVWIPIAPGA